MQLQPNNCSLLIEKFNPYTHTYDSYSSCVSTRYTGGSCTCLTIQNGTLYTDKGNIYSKLEDKDYSETVLVLDDLGMVRLQGMTKDNNTSPVLNTVFLKSNASNDDGLVQVD